MWIAERGGTVFVAGRGGRVDRAGLRRLVDSGRLLGEVVQESVTMECGSSGSPDRVQGTTCRGVRAGRTVDRDGPVEGKPTWHYGLARMSGWPLRAWCKDRPVWEVRSINSSYRNIAAPEQPR